MSREKQKTDRGLYESGAVAAWVVLTLILIFAGLSLALIVLGGQAYRAIQATADMNAQRRSSVGYVLSRLRAGDEVGAIRLDRIVLDGVQTDVLTLTEEIDGEAYETRIYCAGGQLREQFVAAEIPLESAQDGETIAALSSLEIECDASMLTLTFTHPDGERDVVHAALLSGYEVTP